MRDRVEYGSAFWQLQHTVLTANALDLESLAQIAARLALSPLLFPKQQKGVHTLVLATPLKGLRSLPTDLLAHLPATSLITDAGNYYP